MHRFLKLIFLGFIATTMLSAAAYAGERIALVISVSGYSRIAPLKNPPRDAKLVAAALRKVGFDVTELQEPDRTGMLGQLSAFGQRAASADAAIIYYAGHGVEIDGKNYLLPRDVTIGGPKEVGLTALRATDIAEYVRGARNIRLVILDACRDNPFANDPAWSGGTRGAGMTRGLAREIVEDVVMLYAAQPGQKAADSVNGNEPNSPFATVLTKVITTPGLTIAQFPTRVRNGMASIANLTQRPDIQGIWGNDEWQFVAGARPPAEPPRPLAPQPLVATAVVPAAEPAAVRRFPPEMITAFGIVVLRNEVSGNGILIKSVQPRGSAEGKVFPDDIITRINGEMLDPNLSPGQAIAAALSAKGVARLQIQRGPTTTSVVLRP